MKQTIFLILVLVTALIFSACQEKNKTKSDASISKTDVQNNAGKKESEIKVTFIELGSANCIPCKMMKKVMDEIESEYNDQVKIVFYDVRTSEGQPYAKKYAIRVIPTQIFLDKNGKEFYRHEGYFAKEELVKILKTQGVQ